MKMLLLEDQELAQLHQVVMTGQYPRVEDKLIAAKLQEKMEFAMQSDDIPEVSEQPAPTPAVNGPNERNRAERRRVNRTKS